MFRRRLSSVSAFNRDATGVRAHAHAGGVGVKQFLSSPFVAGYRNSPPADLDRKHYQADGLHHVDCVVGCFAAEAGCGIQYHYPSLVQHTGEESYMYPGITVKNAARFSEFFPGEDVSALSLLEDVKSRQP